MYRLGVPSLILAERLAKIASSHLKNMAYRSYAHFIEELDRMSELVRISEPVATELEITEMADRQMKSPGGGKALLFEKPTIDGRLSPFPVAINTMGSQRRMALAMGLDRSMKSRTRCN